MKRLTMLVALAAACGSTQQQAPPPVVAEATPPPPRTSTPPPQAQAPAQSVPIQPVGGSETPGSPVYRMPGVTVEALIDGLTNLYSTPVVAKGDPQEILVDATTVLEEGDIDRLLKSLNENAKANQNAADLTRQLRDQSVLRSGERVVGVSGGRIYKLSR